ncbi:MAG TPA: protein kinase [Polyangiaceae bacterium]
MAAARSVSTGKPHAERVQASTRYVVREKIASGGMGTVYRVLDATTGNELALKRPSAGKVHGGLVIESFEREYQVLASLDHPRIIRVFDYGVDDIGAYYAMELIPGEDLRRGAPVPFRQACLYMRDVATCLALLHARRLLHRDLSASNVRRTADGHCKLLDFGALMPFGVAETVVGTPPGVPPEALDNAPLDQRADLYALGALAYWTLTGQHAYPARSLGQLYEVWDQPPPAPSVLVPDIPRELDGLVLSLLSLDPFARPGSAAEVIARLNVIAELPEEDATEAQRLAQSFLVNPRFAGRARQLSQIQATAKAAANGKGGAVRIAAPPGAGRTRLLQEVAVRTQLGGAAVLRVDAGIDRSQQGTTRALVSRLLEALPQDARQRAARFRQPLQTLGSEIEKLLEGPGVSAPSSAESVPSEANLEGWFAEISRVRPLAVLVDNVEQADNESVALLAALAKLAATHPLLVVVTERTNALEPSALGLVALRAHSTSLELPPLTAEEMLELTRSLFGDAPNVKRFAEWLQSRSAGSPLHAIEIVRQLMARQVLRFTGGIWTIPFDKPDAELPAALEDVLSLRVGLLSEAARTLAECLSLQKERPTLELCRLIAQTKDSRELFGLLDELARNDVVFADRDGYRFSSLALAQVLLAGIDSERLAQSHLRLGKAFTELAREDDAALKVQAGWHLIQGGDERHGADVIARVAADPVAIRVMLANLHKAGHALAAALDVYGKHRLSVYERLPLLASLAQAGYYEDRAFAERYGDQALDALEFVSGLHLARRLRRFMGRWLSLIVALSLAALRFRFVPRAERHYSFADVLIHLLGSVTTCVATAALTLDGERAARAAATLEPFSVLPERLTPAGIYEFCRALGEICRDNEAEVYDTFDKLLRRFQDPRYYPSLPEQGRKIYVAASHLARASIGIFRAHGETVLESADALEKMDFKLHQTMASQLRFLYYMNRGEYAKAAAHRDELELRAAHLGSLWQVEIWEAPALILVHTLLSDVVASTRVAQHLEILSQSVPSMKRYAVLAKHSLMRARGDPKYAQAVERLYRGDVPRSYIAWGAMRAFLARGYNEIGEYSEAKRVCESALEHLTDADREYVAHFLGLDIQLAIADAGLGDFAAGLLRLDSLLKRFADCDHPLVQGLLHDARARIAYASGDVAAYERSLSEVERWFVNTGTPILIAKYKRLAELSQVRTSLVTRKVLGRASTEPPPIPDDEFLTRTLCDSDVPTRSLAPR